MTTPSADALGIPWNAENSYPFYERRCGGATSSSTTEARIGRQGGEVMTTAAMVSYAYDQIDQARTELTAVRNKRHTRNSLFRVRVARCHLKLALLI
jgi:hypothetical protein